MLVQNNGLVVCQPSPQKAVQQIAPFVGEKDSSVRNAALNTLVIFYENMGDAIYKHVGRVSLCFPSPPLLLPLTPHPTLYCCLPPLPSTSSLIKISPCSKSGSADQPRSLLLRPTPQSPYKRSSPLPMPRGRGKREGRRRPTPTATEGRSQGCGIQTKV